MKRESSVHPRLRSPTLLTYARHGAWCVLGVFLLVDLWTIVPRLCLKDPLNGTKHSIGTSSVGTSCLDIDDTKTRKTASVRRVSSLPLKFMLAIKSRYNIGAWLINGPNTYLVVEVYLFTLTNNKKRRIFIRND